VLERADILVVGTPHAEYAAIDARVPVYDIWNVVTEGVRV
jgi:UDP-N-acetyl-D-mannosaminuronic acid dehydrogenase